MENSPTEVDENQDAKGSQSAENFQKFMYELFEKNGVMNDLRSYLRGHIINVLRSAQTGDLPSCQKHFTQRLELTYQAMNILIAEYLLRLEFSYTMSVFISEIPLANMVFSFTKALMKKVDNDDSMPRFKDSDVWSILNYLGVKCDSEHATSIVEMYRVEQNSPLLLCILKSAPLFKEPILVEPISANSSQESQSSKSSDSIEDKCKSQEKCRHYVSCKACQSNMVKVKEKYNKKKKHIAKNLKDSSINSLNVESLMKNISLMERSLIDEMFNEMKSVYEAEIDLIKQDEEKRVKRSLVTHSTQLQIIRDEMEDSFKAREAQLEKNVQQKKQFLWGLAKALREQHRHMARAMRDVRAETNRLTAKEDSLKAQLASAEVFLSERGADMRQQISDELVVLEAHLESMKRERDSINRERTRLEWDKDTTNKHIENEDLKSHYDLLRNELNILKKYLETTKLEPKCVIERSTITDLNGVSSRIDVVLNNGQDVERRSEEDRVKPKQLLNDLKKQKNVNFNQSNIDEIFRERSQSRSRSSASSEAGDAQFDTEADAQRLSDENQQLRSLARQQREQIDRLTSQQARLQTELSAPPSPAPASSLSPATYALQAHRMCSSASVNNFSSGWRKGAGEELSLFSNAQPRILVPADTIPFVGALTTHTESRRYLINQWRTLRRRMSPLCGGGISKIRATSPIQRYFRERPVSAGPCIRIHLDTAANDAPSEPNSREAHPHGYQRPHTSSSIRTRDINLDIKSAFKQDNLKSKGNIKDYPLGKEKSPNGVLREAKLRLRKLEIEAEAVEHSYLDYRRKQETFRDGRKRRGVEGYEPGKDDKPTTYKLDETYTKESTSRQERYSTIIFEKYFQEYQTKFNERFKNRNTAAFTINPIPEAYSTRTKYSENYLEKPLNEFRKYYQTEARFSKEPFSPSGSKLPKSGSESKNSSVGTRKEILRQAKHDKDNELVLLKHNIGKMYNMPEQEVVTPNSNDLSNNEIELKESKRQGEPSIETNAEMKPEENLLRIEVESGGKIDGVTDSISPNMLLVVSSVDNTDTELSECESNRQTHISIILSPNRSTSIKESLTESLKSSRIGSIPHSPEIGITSPTKLPKSPKKDIPDSGNSRKSESKSDNMMPDDVPIYQDDNEHVSSVQMEVGMFKDILDSELEKHEDPDDFSADADNYNISENGTHSPISLPKTSEDENFWDT